ncbi:unnamed protein product [Linum trigynum]|uniref:Uncharacterized protein n=1 Tax=Linum trigynum TaxID=586398 RepID=A0AAV2GGE7_9ROSI
MLKNADDIHQLLTRSSSLNGGRVTEGIYLDLSEVNEMRLEAKAFDGMTSLRCLKFLCPRNENGAIKVRVPYGGLDFLPDSLRWLRWDIFPSKYLPSTFSPEKLVTLSLRGSPILERCWEVEPPLVNLVWLDLSHCINLVAIPNLSGSQKLEYLLLQGCKSLIEIPSHLQDLDKLVAVFLDDCTNLRSLPPKFNSKFFKSLWLANCPKITRCPEINSGELVSLNLLETPIIALPSAIHDIKQGGRLYLCGEHIASFPVILTSLKEFRLCHTRIREMDCYDYDDDQQDSLPRFVRLDLVCNPQLKGLSRNIWKMVSQTLTLQNCPLIETLPEISQPVTELTQLSITGSRNLKSFPTGINNLNSLQQLDFDGTAIKSLPSALLELDQLSILNLSFNKSLEFIPSDINKLAKLSLLCLAGCSRILSLPDLPPNLLTLTVSGCELLQALPSNIRRLRWKDLYFEDCSQLDTNLPKEILNNFPDHAASNLHPQGVLQYSGSEFPEWFAYTSVDYKNDSCMMVQLPPPNSTITRSIKGIAFGVVCSSDIGLILMSITWEANFGTSAAASWSSPGSGFGFGLTQSDNVFIWYEKNLLGEIKKGIPEEAEPWYERYAGRAVSFRFSVQPVKGEDPEKLKSIKIKTIGVSLLY